MSLSFGPIVGIFMRDTHSFHWSFWVDWIKAWDAWWPSYCKTNTSQKKIHHKRKKEPISLVPQSSHSSSSRNLNILEKWENNSSLSNQVWIEFSSAFKHHGEYFLNKKLFICWKLCLLIYGLNLMCKKISFYNNFSQWSFFERSESK